MKKFFLATLMATGFLLSTQAKAHVEYPLWNCALTFQAKGGGIQVILGKFSMKGTGNIRCVDIAGNTEVIPVRVSMTGKCFSPNIALGAFHLYGFATGIGVAHEPESLLGKYVIAGGTGALLIGGGANVGVHGGRDSITFDLGLQVGHGLGVQAGITKLKISAL